MGSHEPISLHLVFAILNGGPRLFYLGVLNVLGKGAVLHVFSKGRWIENKRRRTKWKKKTQ